MGLKRNYMALGGVSPLLLASSHPLVLFSLAYIIFKGLKSYDIILSSTNIFFSSSHHDPSMAEGSYQKEESGRDERKLRREDCWAQWIASLRALGGVRLRVGQAEEVPNAGLIWQRFVLDKRLDFQKNMHWIFKM